MRLQLDPQPLRLDLAADAIPDSMSGDAQRIVGGLVVPYGVWAQIGGRRVRFEEGAVAAREHVPYVLGHDLDRPIGTMVTSAQGAAGLSGVFAVDRTPDGDVAIAQAKSGSRRGLSAGVDVTDGLEDPATGDLVVAAGELVEVSQVTLAAYADAAITQIAASHREGAEMPDDQITTPPEPELQAAPAAELEPDPRPRPVIVTAEREPPRLRLGQLVQTMIRAAKGDRDAAIRVEAALNREELADSPGVVPIAYVTQLVDSLGYTRPLFDAFTKAELPPAGMMIRRPAVTARPDDAGSRWLADDTAAAPTGSVSIGNLDTPIAQWAFAGAASTALVERSAPSYVEEAFTQMIRAYYRDVEEKIGAALVAIAAPATSPPSTLGGAAALYMSAYRSFPDMVVVGPVAFGKIVDALGQLRYATGSADLAGGGAIVAGLRVVPSADVAAGDAWITSRELLESRESTPLRLSVSNVTSLSLELGVTSFFGLTHTLQTLATVPGAVRIAAFVPVTAEMEAPSTSRRGRSAE